MHRLVRRRQPLFRIESKDPEQFLRVVQGLPSRIGDRSARMGQPLRFAGRELVEIVVTTVDITERKRAEDKLRRTWDYLAETQRLTHTGTSVADPTTAPVYWSEEMFRIFGIDPQQGLPTRDQPLQRIHPEDRDKFQQAFQRAIHDKVDADVEYRVVLPDGTVKHIYGLGHPILNASGELVEVVCTVVDITERKRAEDALQRSEANLAEGQRLTHTGSWAWSPATAERNYWSEEMYRIFGFEPQASPPALEKFLQRIHPDDHDRTTQNWEKSLREKSHLVEDFRIVLPDGTVRDIHIIGHPARDDTGEHIEYIGTAMDVTERKRAEDELRKHREHLEDLMKQRTEQLAEAKARAEAANRAKSTFLANMSHELRTPLNAVLGFSRLLKNDPGVTPPQQESLDVIVRSGEHLLNLINNVLDLAKIESGRVAMKPSEVDLRRLLHEMQSLMGVAGDGRVGSRPADSGRPGADTKIIALTAHALEEERVPIMAAGCDDLVRKPFREQELFGALARHLHLKFIYEEPPRQESPPEAPELALNPERLDALPAQLLQELRQAVVELDTARTQSLIEQVAERDGSLGRALSTLATRLDYPRLLELLERGRSHTDETL